MTFKPGDRVIDTIGRRNPNRDAGARGIVLSISEGGAFLRVSFDDPSVNNHDYENNGSDIRYFRLLTPDEISAEQQQSCRVDAEYYLAITGDAP